MIVTVTANTALDHIIGIEGSLSQEVIKASWSVLVPAGKGVNVSRAVESLGERSTAVCVIGSETRPLFEGLTRGPQTHYEFIEVPGATRSNITVRGIDSRASTHIRTEGYSTSAGIIDQLTRQVTAKIGVDSLVIISGSLPRGADEQTYATLIRECKSHGAKVLFDSSGPEFRQGLRSKPFAVKPNLSELSELAGYGVPNEDKRIATLACSDLFEGVDLIVITRGAKGAIVYSRLADRLLKAWIKRDLNPSIVNEVGAGDVFLGALAVALDHKLSLREAVAQSVAWSAASLLSITPGACTREHFDELAPLVVVEDFTS